MKPRAQLLAVLLGCGALCPPVAADNWRGVADYALEAKLHNVAFASPWLDSIRVETNRATIRRADGSAIMLRPALVASGYDRSVRHDLSRFYRPDNPRINLLMRYAGRRAGEVISLGLDSGYSAEKITVKPALFVGYTRAFEMRKRLYLTAGMGGWLGGKVSEKACYDSYSRAYYCPTLTAWSEHKPRNERMTVHGSLVLTYVFGSD